MKLTANVNELPGQIPQKIYVKIKTIGHGENGSNY